MYKNLGITKNRWQGDGVSNCINPLWGTIRLRSAVNNRKRETGYVDKVYRWTVDLSTSVRTMLSRDVDAIMTNHPERVKNVLQELQFRRRFRMALKSDNPWERTSAENTFLIFRAPPLFRFMSAMFESTSSLVDFIINSVQGRALSGVMYKAITFVQVFMDLFHKIFKARKS
ncbi:dermonecrotic toxin LarSicTox-alphaI-1-like [Tachypleus tridentatus]|uniref:dermonecrotic toxin LarSicTox-alphaI-1-like n=1 Tax=Tachypleus tridentatus TaxID=6853 RepID=UPI003FD063E1